jgi:hypothetical protein
MRAIITTIATPATFNFKTFSFQAVPVELVECLWEREASVLSRQAVDRRRTIAPRAITQARGHKRGAQKKKLGSRFVIGFLRLRT